MELRTLELRSGHGKMEAGMPLGDTLYSMLLKSLAAKEPRTPGAHLEAHVDDTMFESTASQPGHC